MDGNSGSHMSTPEEVTQRLARIKKIYADFIARMRSLEQEENSIIHSIFKDMDEERIKKLHENLKKK